MTVVYSLQGKFQKTCEVTVYIDGRACCKENVKAPAVTEVRVRVRVRGVGERCG